MANNQVSELKKALDIHIYDNKLQFEQGTIRDANFNKKLDEIKDIIDGWTPYITDGIKKSEAYKYVSKDLKCKSNSVKWWVGFIIIFFSFMGMLYSILEKTHLIK